MAGQIVVVDDEQCILDIVSDVLEMEGYSVVQVGRPQDVERLKHTIDPSLFLIDIMLPGMSGVELAQELRDYDFVGTPMIAMSASTFLMNAVRHCELFQATIAKPFDIDTLVSVVKRHMHDPAAGL